jgi:hypothetical protein
MTQSCSIRGSALVLRLPRLWPDSRNTHPAGGFRLQIQPIQRQHAERLSYSPAVTAARREAALGRSISRFRLILRLQARSCVLHIRALII